ncbi:MAG: hypothetical protein K5648_09750 [Erysipelotrichaceae bacterium]|nr:hypothetical protein [Erysipelotrichaceae bacterium]
MKKWKPLWHQALTRSLFDGKPFSKNRTVVFSLHLPYGAETVRLRFNNLFGNSEYHFGAVTIAYEKKIKDVFVHGNRDFTIAIGERVFSDPVEIKETKDIEIRIFYKDEIIDCNMIEEDANWLKGDQTHKEVLPERIRKPFLGKILGSYNAIPSIDLIEAYTEEEVSAVVAFGDSITAMSRWTKPLGKRLEDAYQGRYVLLNSGISGNCLLYEAESVFAPVFGQKGVDRFERDVLSLNDVSTVILALGVNDVSYLNDSSKDIINLQNYIAALTKMSEMLHARGIRVVMQTVTPRLKVARTMGKYDQRMEKLRLEINEWIRSAGIFDDVIDQDVLVRDKDKNGYFFMEGLHQGDHLHPNAEGGRRMAENFDLQKLTGEKI